MQVALFVYGYLDPDFLDAAEDPRELENEDFADFLGAEVRDAAEDPEELEDGAPDRTSDGEFCRGWFLLKMFFILLPVSATFRL